MIAAATAVVAEVASVFGFVHAVAPQHPKPEEPFVCDGRIIARGDA